MKLQIIISLALALSVTAVPTRIRDRRAADAATQKANGQQATSENNNFKTLTATSSCTAGQDACVNDQFAQCVGGKFVLQACGPGTICASLPLLNSAGTSITCTTAADRDARIAAATGSSAAAGDSSTSAAAAASTTSAAAASTSSAAAKGSDNASNNNGTAAAGGDPQTSTTLDPAVIAKGFESDGQAQPEAGQVASLTSSNNFINFCLTQTGKPITNGQQIKGGSCNPAPMGVIAATTNIPSSKFQNPPNLGTIKATTSFDIKMAISNLETGNFVNANSNYYSAPQQVNAQGNIVGHSHFVIEKLDSLTQTTPTNPGTFAFFKGVNAPAENGILTATVDGGLPEGAYRLSSINTAANHQPVLVAVAQHGSMDDQIYFTVTADGKAAAGSAAAAAPAATTSAAAAATTSAAKGGKN